jgi:hypothetical protein
MGQGRFRLLFAMATVLAAALIFAGSAAAKPSCASRLIDDWRDGGRIDGTYPVSCYRQALAQLPEDVRVYSSAQSDITRALQSRLSTRSLQSVAGASNKDERAGVSPLLVVAITAAILVAAGSVAAALR